MVKPYSCFLLLACLWMAACKNKGDQHTTPADTTAGVSPATAAPATPAPVPPAVAAAPVKMTPHPAHKTKKTRRPPSAFVSDTYVPEHVDTIRKDIYDTIVKPYTWSYSPSSETVDSFSTVFDKDICAPGDESHPLYTQYLAKAASLAGAAREGLKNRLKSGPAYRLEPFPVYYLTYNVLGYRSSDSSFTHFFNLDTATMWYRLFDGNKFLGIIGYRDGRSFAGRFKTGDSLSYSRIERLHHQPLGFFTSLTSSLYRFTNSFDFFGYLDNGHLVFAITSAGDYLQQHPGDRLPTEVYVIDSKTVLAEAWYLGGYGSPQVLTQYVDHGTSNLDAARARPAHH